MSRLPLSMENQQVDNKFTWVIKNFSTPPSIVISSDNFVIGGCKWRIRAYPKGLASPGLSLNLEVADFMSLPYGWRRHARYRLTVINQKNSEKSFKQNETQMWFDRTTPFCYSQAKLPLTKLNAKDGGFLVNNEVKIVAEVEVLEVIGKLDVFEAAETQQPLKKKIKLEKDNAVSNDLHNESIDVNGFQVLPSQVDFVRHMFEKHPDIALEFRPKNPLLKTAYMNVLLNLTKTLRKSLGEISKDDLADAYGSLGSMREAGFNLDWLEKKLNEVSKKKEKEEAYETRMREIEEELKNLKAKVLATRAPLDDVF